MTGAGSGLVSLYTGAGGLDIGAESAGFSIKLCAEIDPVRVQTLRLNRPEWQVMNQDVASLSSASVRRRACLRRKERFFLAAGSPCQPYSKSAFWVPDRISRIHLDHRTRTLWHFARFVRELRPHGFIFENVHGLLFRPSRPLFHRLVSSLRKGGYGLTWTVINAAGFGVPQRRERLFLVGLKDHQEFTFPKPTHVQTNHVSARQAFLGLPDIKEDMETVKGKWGHLLPKIPPGKNYLYLSRTRGRRKPIFRWRSRYWSFLLKLAPELPSWTIQARPGPYVGPFHWDNRRLRIPEVKRLQTFPDDYRIVGSRASAWSQLGDATPPLLARELFRALLQQAAS